MAWDAAQPMTRFAIATPSYINDLERCRLLCASVDHFVTDLTMHYLLVENRDVAAFRQFEGPRRRIVAESELLPSWLKPWSDPLSGGRRRVWTGPSALMRGLKPLRGWHAQQLRKLALPLMADEDVFLYADSDVIFLKPFAQSDQIGPQGIRLYAKRNGIVTGMDEHVGWLNHATDILGLPTPALPATDYINNLATWTGPNVRALMKTIEARTSRHWIEAVCKDRSFSEMMIYGVFAEGVLGSAAGHAPSDGELSRTYWFQKDVQRDSFRAAGPLLAGPQVSIGVQSFIGVPLEDLWAVFRQAAARS
jgi:hypothetical protein